MDRKDSQQLSRALSRRISTAFTTRPSSSMPAESAALLSSMQSGSLGLETARSGMLRGTKSGTAPGMLSSITRQQAQADAYLSELLTFSLDRLKKEPEILAEEKQQLERGLQAMAVTHHSAFIAAASALQTISTELDATVGHLDALLQHIPGVASACEAFSSQGARVLDAYARNKQLAGQQPLVLELLEVPTLMDTCARNGVYDEALDLQAYVSRMGMLHHDLPVVQMLQSQVADVSTTMLQALLGRLRQGIALPECLRVMGYLRRLGAFSEAQLRQHFLKCRDDWISGLVSELDDSEPYEYVKQLVDVHRLHLFDAVMQYRAIFFDTTAPATHLAGQLPAAGSTATHHQTQDAAALLPSVRESALLHSWVQHRLALFVGALSATLPLVTQGSNLASIIDQCTYCGSSLARVGLDFTGLLLPLFERCSLALLSGHLAAAVDVFNARLEAHRWVPLLTPMPGAKQRQPAPDAAGEDGKASRSDGGTAQEATTPPYVLMEHLPLAVFTNGVLTALNEARQCALQSCAKPAAGLLQQATEHMASSLSHYYATRTLSDSEAPLLRAMVRAALDVLLPYFTACFARVFQGTGQKLDCGGAATILRSVLQGA